jgi:hypothetical protein
MSNATDTNLECVILIVFPLPQWERERALKLGYTYIDCLIPVMALLHTIVTVGWQHYLNGRACAVVT